MKKNTFIRIEEVELFYRKHCKDVGIKFSKRNFMNFLRFLEIDFFDWIKSNLKYFNENKT